ncbi:MULTISPECIES: radical SAM family heme chaperone HemW [Rhodanobacter]|uniref:radical SAM family heme chaperone HemW n=1 Tax=Rhodanobacter TaxID=75309 RepID=UPI000260C806|nr:MULTISPECIES: radical SAM family heme chaperone HemW [Rhodanobacter]EIM03630.1 HemN family oxidoreductase [Rhodanobacter denitrificans]KZC20774.1 YggW family oxidoreductase [Rhodanobacter denitrificans]UJJ50522.1 radical SAM family heme chaperone HemW [Rhodanobacter denitrificans]UJM91153.1 radical SAM family heme chaperone HemW [Rhodanobacter denitrificans]UJM93238.1 radical SAM family heme chaperone HemW [Rhodanobacter denitrificans]
MSLIAPPLSLYVHMPWCVKKCPYCDFNSHGLRSEPPPYAQYIDHLLADLDADRADFAPALEGRPVVSVFFGGGTPSLFAPELIARLLDGVRERLPLADDVEITLETNPGTVEHGSFDGYLAAGVNRISFGIQSFDDDKLRRLGRIHSAGEAEAAVKSAQDAGYANINLDLMYALPKQELDGALADVERAVALKPTHISHYQLTLEPNTAFAANPPPLPDDDHAWAMQEACEARLAATGYGQYEISAYAQPGRRCVHNLNYWQFGDYLGIGAGAHGKLSDAAGGQVRRRWKTRGPRAYLDAAGGPARIGGDHTVGAGELPFEYMLNALRLVDGVPMAAFAERTGLPPQRIAAALAAAVRRGWLHDDPQRLHTTVLGQRFLNDVIGTFLD